MKKPKCIRKPRGKKSLKKTLQEQIIPMELDTWVLSLPIDSTVKKLNGGMLYCYETNQFYIYEQK